MLTQIPAKYPDLMPHTFSRHDAIPLQPDALWLLKQGVVRTLTWSAEIIGTTRVTVTRLLNEFEREGIISRHRRHFITLRSNF